MQAAVVVFSLVARGEALVAPHVVQVAAAAVISLVARGEAFMAPWVLQVAATAAVFSLVTRVLMLPTFAKLEGGSAAARGLVPKTNPRKKQERKTIKKAFGSRSSSGN